MKLKKIASLALAGTMAVSMLAACGTDAGSSNSGEQDPTTNVSSVVEAVNDGQSAVNQVKVDFASDSELDSALKRTVEKYGHKATLKEVTDSVTTLTGINYTPLYNNTWSSYVVKGSAFKGTDSTVKGGLISGDVKYVGNHVSSKGDLDGKTNTIYGVAKYTGYYGEEAVLKAVAADVNKLVAQLAKTSDDTDNNGKLDANVVVGGANDADKYYTYSYDGNVAMTSTTNPDGTVDYYVAVVINQDVAKASL